MTTSAKFAGFPAEAFRFYEDLEVDNSKAFWEAHRATYEAACHEPMEALLEELAPEFGNGKLFRPYRDVRFSADKSPYKTSCSALIGQGGYIALSADGLYVGGGVHTFEGTELQRYRAAVASDVAGAALQNIVETLRRKHYEVDGDALKSAPRGFAPDHPRIELLRYKGLHAGHNFPANSSVTNRAIVTQIRKTLRDIQPLVNWITEHCRG